MEQDKLSNTEKNDLNRFRSSLADVLTPNHTDAVLLKWLRARNFHLRKAEHLFRQVDLYRKIHDLDNIVENYVKPKVIQKHERTWFLGFAKDGAPVRYSCLNADMSGLIQSVNCFDADMYFIQTIERDLQAMRKHNVEAGLNHSEIIYIVDMENCTLLQELTNKSFLEIMWDYFRNVQDLYPEVWRLIMVVNAPSLFAKFLLIFKPILKKTFLQKIHIASKSTTKDLLRQYIDDDVLPTFLGGKRSDSKGDPHCGMHLNPYSKVPEEYYLKNTVHFMDERDPGVKVVTIRARGCYNVSMVLKQPGCNIRTEIRTENGSIGFLIFYRELGPDPEKPDLPGSDEYIDPSDENSSTLSAGFKHKIQSHISPCDETWTAVKPGIYIWHFDNTSSWLGSRRLFYRVTVTPVEM